MGQVLTTKPVEWGAGSSVMDSHSAQVVDITCRKCGTQTRVTDITVIDANADMWKSKYENLLGQVNRDGHHHLRYLNYLLMNHNHCVASNAIVSRACSILSGYYAAFNYPTDSRAVGRCIRVVEELGIDIAIMRGFNRMWDDMVDAWPHIVDVHSNPCRLGSTMTLITMLEDKYVRAGTLVSSHLLYEETKINAERPQG